MSNEEITMNQPAMRKQLNQPHVLDSVGDDAMTNQVMLTCSRCRQQKDLSQFSTQKPFCLQCRAEQEAKKQWKKMERIRKGGRYSDGRPHKYRAR